MTNRTFFADQLPRLREFLIGSGLALAMLVPTFAEEAEYTTIPARTAPTATRSPQLSQDTAVQPNDAAPLRLDIDAEVRSIRELRRRGEIAKARSGVVVLVANLEKRNVAVSSDVRLLEARLHIEYGRTLPQEGNQRTVLDPKRGTIVEIVNPAKDQYRQAGDVLRAMVKAEPHNTAAWILFLRAASNEARPTAKTPLDRNQMQWVHDNAKQLLRNANLSRQEQAQLRYLLGIAHFELPCGTDRGRADFAESLRLFTSHQAEDTVYGFDGIRLISTTLPDLWEPR